MHKLHRWLPTLALRHFNGLAGRHPDNFERRYDWGSYQEGPALTEANLDSVYAEVIAKIPAGVTKVLEIGCGGGKFAAALRAAKPGLGYRGIDLVPANVATAQALLPAEDFQVGNASEYLHAAAVDWDFIVSVGCLFHTTDKKSKGLHFDLLDSKSSKGFVVLANPAIATPAFLTARMAEALTASTDVTASYFEGDRDFLLEVLLSGVLHPFYVHRTSTTAAAPASLYPRECLIAKGTFNEVLAVHETRKTRGAGLEDPTTVMGVVQTGGLVSSVEAVAIDPAWVAHVTTQPRPVVEGGE